MANYLLQNGGDASMLKSILGLSDAQAKALVNAWKKVQTSNNSSGGGSYRGYRGYYGGSGGGTTGGFGELSIEPPADNGNSKNTSTGTVIKDNTPKGASTDTATSPNGSGYSSFSSAISKATDVSQLSKYASTIAGSNLSSGDKEKLYAEITAKLKKLRGGNSSSSGGNAGGTVEKKTK
jgi:hypothetical protein